MNSPPIFYVENGAKAIKGLVIFSDGKVVFAHTADDTAKTKVELETDKVSRQEILEFADMIGSRMPSAKIYVFRNLMRAFDDAYVMLVVYAYVRPHVHDAEKLREAILGADIVDLMLLLTLIKVASIDGEEKLKKAVEAFKAFYGIA